jgi:hypothetical protein
MSREFTQLNEVIPAERFAETYAQVCREVLATTVEQWRTRRSKDIPSTMMFIWDEMVHRGIARSPFKVAPIVNSGFKGIYEFIEEELGHSPLSDAFAVEYFNELEPTSSFAEVSLVQCFPNDLHISDVEFSDQRHPLPATHPDRRHRKYKGLHVFEQFLDRLRSVARARGTERISGLVASPPVHHVLARHGFQISDSKMALAAYRRTGQGHAMILRV